MPNSPHRWLPAMFLLATLFARAAQAQPASTPAPFNPPDDISFRTASIMSEGTRMAAEVYSLKSLDGKRLPTIVLCHGWGGTARDLRPEGVAFARAGYLVVAIDYRGWGESDARLVLDRSVADRETANRRFTAEVQEVREVVDPIDQTTDLHECDPLGRRRSAVRPRPHRSLGFELLRRPRRLRRGPRPARQGHRQPGARTRFAVGRRRTP